MLLRRRNFLAGALGLPFICPGRAHAQTAAGPPEIGFVYEGIAPAGAVRAKAFQEGLKSKGYEDGRNVVTVVRNAELNPERFEPLVRELLQRDVKILFGAMVLLRHLFLAAGEGRPQQHQLEGRLETSDFWMTRGDLYDAIMGGAVERVVRR
jgi:hypothetical protein